MTNRTSRGDRRNADARRSIRHQKYMSLSDAINLFIRAEERIRPYLDQAGWLKIDGIPSQVGWEQAGYVIDEEYCLMKLGARKAALSQPEPATSTSQWPCTCLPDSDICCPACQDAIRARYGDEIPFEAQS